MWALTRVLKMGKLAGHPYAVAFVIVILADRRCFPERWKPVGEMLEALVGPWVATVRQKLRGTLRFFSRALL